MQLRADSHHFSLVLSERVNAKFFAAIIHAIVVITTPLNTLFMVHFSLCLLVPTFELGHVVEKIKILDRLFTVFKSEAQTRRKPDVFLPGGHSQ